MMFASKQALVPIGLTGCRSCSACPLAARALRPVARAALRGRSAQRQRALAVPGHLLATAAPPAAGAAAEQLAAGHGAASLADVAELFVSDGAAMDAAIAAALWIVVAAAAAFSLFQMFGAFQQAKATIDRREEDVREKDKRDAQAAADKKRRFKEMFERL